MEETTTIPRSQFSVALRYALISSLVMIVYYLILFILKLETKGSLTWISYLLLAIIMYLGIKDYRDKDLGTYISFGKAFSLGIFIVFLTSIIYTIFNLIFIYVIDPSFIADIMQKQMQQMQERDMTQQQMDMAVKWTKVMMSPGILSVITIIGFCFIGLIISLIEALILKKDNPEMPQA